jgi:predicted small lipoprotein YifL
MLKQISLLILVSIALTGCGQTGKLYLPRAKPPVETNHATAQKALTATKVSKPKSSLTQGAS